MLWLARGAAVIGLIFYLSPARHASDAPPAVPTAALDRAMDGRSPVAAVQDRLDASSDVVSRLREALLRGEREATDAAGVAVRQRLLSAVDADTASAARPVRVGDEQASAAIAAARDGPRAARGAMIPDRRRSPAPVGVPISRH
jgi:hypothetical protein